MIYLGDIITCLLIAVSLSMDAFSLSLVYGTQGLEKIEKIILAITVGVFHFFMPLIGFCFGSLIMKYFVFNLNLVVGIFFLIIGIEMVISSNSKENVRGLVSFVYYLFFGFSVSLDSLTTGIGLSAISNNYLFVASLFMIVSGIFTYFGLILGGRLSEKFGRYATISGGVILILLALYYIFRI